MHGMKITKKKILYVTLNANGEQSQFCESRPFEIPFFTVLCYKNIFLCYIERVSFDLLTV
jgi:hypothetical protein